MPDSSTKEMREVECRAPFRIDCVGQIPATASDYERFCRQQGEPECVTSNDTLILEVATSRGKYRCRARREAFNALFRSIKELGVEIEF